MSNPNEQTPPPLPHQSPPPLRCSKPPAAPGVPEKPTNRSAVAAGPPYSQCYYPDTSFQKFQPHHQFFVAETSQSQSPPPPAVMDPSLLLNSKASHDSSIKQTNLMEHMVPNAQRTKSPSKEGEFCHPFFPPFGSGLEMLSAAASKSASPRKLKQYAHRSGASSIPTPPPKIKSIT